ncbi:MAG: bnr repeat-containing protein [Deltaproteobacteria bacterium]|nr:bnr repeat-containing protein [Deltaproteobacteria bacterium]
MWAPNAWAVGALVVVAGCDVVFGLERPKPAPGAWERVTAGRHHTCGLKVDGTLWCWGDNGYGQTGGGQMVPFLEVPTQIGEATWIDVASQDDHTCGIQTDGTLWCWGLNGQAQCGTHYEQNEGRLFVPTLVDAGSWSAVATGFEHSCAIRTDGSLWCWGEGVYGQLGDGSDLRRSMPTRAAGEAWTTISLGFDHTCGLQGDKLWCFGSNFQGQLADPTVGDRMLPNLVEGTWDEVAAGDGFTCARRDGQVMCWGVNDEGQLGNGTTRNSKIGSALGGGASNWSAIAAGRTHAAPTVWTSSARARPGRAAHRPASRGPGHRSASVMPSAARLTTRGPSRAGGATITSSSATAPTLRSKRRTSSRGSRVR